MKVLGKNVERENARRTTVDAKHCNNHTWVAGSMPEIPVQYVTRA
jgi:hypothetical protein